MVTAVHVISLEHKLADIHRELDDALSQLGDKDADSDSRHQCQSDTTEWEQRIVKLKKRLDTLKTEVCGTINDQSDIILRRPGYHFTNSS